jgi:hypothetical protein
MIWQPVSLGRVLEEFDQFLALVIGAGDVVAAAHVDPLELAEKGSITSNTRSQVAFSGSKSCSHRLWKWMPSTPSMCSSVSWSSGKPRRDPGRRRIILGDFAGGTCGLMRRPTLTGAPLAAACSRIRRARSCWKGELKIT